MKTKIKSIAYVLIPVILISCILEIMHQQSVRNTNKIAITQRQLGYFDGYQQCEVDLININISNGNNFIYISNKVDSVFKESSLRYTKWLHQR